MGVVVCFVVIYDVTYDGQVNTDMGDLAWLLIAGGSCILGSGIPKAYTDSRMKTRSWVENEKMQIEAEEELEDFRCDKRKHRRKRVKSSEEDVSLEEENE